MLRFGKTKIKKEEFYDTKKPIEIWDVDADNKVISESIEKKKGMFDWLLRQCFKTISLNNV